MGAAYRIRHVTEDFEVGDCVCDSGLLPDAELLPQQVEILLVRRGAFTIGRRGEESPLTAGCAFLMAAEPHTFRHPAGGGDETTILRLSGPLSDEFRRSSGPRIMMSAASHLLHEVIWRRGPSRLALEEAVYGILRALNEAPHEGRVAGTSAKLVARAELFIAANQARTLSLRDIAGAAGTSPWHLARLFRAVTGTSMHRYQTRLRLREAVRRLSEGESALTSLALDLGFADHSHFSNSFRRAYGIAPSAFRRTARSFKIARPPVV